MCPVASRRAFVVAPLAVADLVASPTSVSICASLGTNPPTQTIFTSENPATGGPTLSPTVSANASWLVLSTASGNTTGSVVNVFVQTNVAGLAVGDYSSQITITQSNLTKSPVIVPVTRQVLPAGVAYCANPSIFQINTPAGVNANAQVLAVTTIGGLNVTPSFTSTTATGGNWLSLSSPTSSTLNATTTVGVSFNTAALTNGFYSGTITATGAGVKNSPLTIPVNLTVGTITSGGPVLSASPTTVCLQRAPASIQPRSRSRSITRDKA